MEQSNIVQETTRQFAEKLEKLGEVRIQDHYENGKKEGQSLIQVTFLCVEEIIRKNMMEKVKLQDRDSDDNLIEYFVPVPSIFRLTFMITPYFKNCNDTMKIMGDIIQIMKDDNIIPVEKYDWVENDGEPIQILPVPEMDLKKQMEIFDYLKADYHPSLFYQLEVGINSEKREIFRRVKERKVSADYIDKVKGRAGD